MKNLKQLIIENTKTSFADFAAECKISRMTLFNVLNERNKPTMKTVKKICNFCKVNFIDFYEK